MLLFLLKGDQLLSFCCLVQDEGAPQCQLLQVDPPCPPQDESQHCSVVDMCDNIVTGVGRSTVKGIEKGDQHAALGGSSD